jgi:hypothetical protein
VNIVKYLFISVLFFSINVFADSSCIECLKKKANNIEGMPGNKTIDSLAAVTKKLAKSVGSRESYQERFCNMFTVAETNIDVETIFEEIDASPYANYATEFWTTAACRAPEKNDSQVPMIFNTAHIAAQAESFPKVVKKYLLEVKHDKTTWYKIINSKSTDGFTFLDYLQYNIDRGNYSTTETIEAVQRIVSYLCSNGGEYNTYKSTSKCP